MITERVAVVVAGAGARGSYEAGALSVLVPRLREAAEGPMTFVGTSAGAINAALLAASAYLPPHGQADAVLAVWHGMSVSNVYRSPLPPDRSDALIAEMKRNDPRFLQRQTRRYLEYLDRHGSLVCRLCDTGARAWVVFGEHDDVGLADDERRALEKCPHVAVGTIPNAGHFTLNEEPGRIAELIVEMVSADTAR